MKVHFDFTQEAQLTDDGNYWKTTLHAPDAPWTVRILIPKEQGTEIHEFRDGDLVLYGNNTQPILRHRYRIRIGRNWLTLDGINHGSTDTTIANDITRGTARLMHRGPNQ